MLGGTPDGGGLPLVPTPHADLLFHLVGYAILAALLVRALPLQSDNSSRTPSVMPLVFVVVVTVAFGLGIEGVQALLPYRTASLLDSSANLLGAVLGAVLMAASARNLRRGLD